jgi:hypothetical protein
MFLNPLITKRFKCLGFKTAAQNGGKIVNPTLRAPLPQGNISGIYFG